MGNRQSTCTADMGATCGRIAVALLQVLLPSGDWDTFPRCVIHPAADYQRLLRKVSPFTVTRVITLAETGLLWGGPPCDTGLPEVCARPKCDHLGNAHTDSESGHCLAVAWSEPDAFGAQHALGVCPCPGFVPQGAPAGKPAERDNDQ